MNNLQSMPILTYNPANCGAISIEKERLCEHLHLTPKITFTAISVRPKVHYKCNDCNHIDYSNFKCAVNHAVKKHKNLLPKDLPSYPFLRHCNFPFFFFEGVAKKPQNEILTEEKTKQELQNIEDIEQELNNADFTNDIIAVATNEIKEQVMKKYKQKFLDLQKEFKVREARLANDLFNAKRDYDRVKGDYERIQKKYICAVKSRDAFKKKFANGLLPYHKNIDCCPICCDESKTLKTTGCCGNQLCEECFDTVIANPLSYRGAECPFCKHC